MTPEQILAADAVTLTVMAHRILGRKIEKYEDSDRGDLDSYTNWRCRFTDGSEWCRVWCDTETPTAELLGKLVLDNFAESWADAQELWEHEKWPKDHWISMEDAKTYLAKGALIDAMFPRYDEGPCLRESSLPPLITRVFVLANHKPEESHE